MAVPSWRRGPCGSGLSRCGLPRHVAACSRSGRDRLVNRPDLAGQRARLSNPAQGERRARAIDTEACSHSPLDVGHDDASERQRSPEKDPCEERHVTHSPGRDIVAVDKRLTHTERDHRGHRPWWPLLALEFAGFCRFLPGSCLTRAWQAAGPAHPHLPYRSRCPIPAPSQHHNGPPDRTTQPKPHDRNPPHRHSAAVAQGVDHGTHTIASTAGLVSTSPP